MRNDDRAAAPPVHVCPDPLTQVVTVADLAARLGVTTGAIRQHLHARVQWLPQPDGRINGGAVWRASTLEGIEDRKPTRGGRYTAPPPDQP
jgi:hypothetical protein